MRQQENVVLKIYNTVCPLAPLGTSKIKRCRKRNLGNCGNFGASPLGVSDAAPFFGACAHPFPLPLSWTLGAGLLERAEDSSSCRRQNKNYITQKAVPHEEALLGSTGRGGTSGAAGGRMFVT